MPWRLLGITDQAHHTFCTCHWSIIRLLTQPCMLQLTDASRSHSRVQKPGPGHLLLTRLHQLHWHLNMHDTFRDENGDPIDLWHAPVQEVYMRVCEAWQAQVAGCIAKRKTFKGMQHTHAFLSIRRLPTEPMDRSLLRNNLDGTFYTADHLPKRDPGLSDNAHTAAR